MRQKQKFKEGDIVQQQYDFHCFMITYAGQTNILPSGKKINFKFWEYIAQPMGFGEVPFAFESYEDDPVECLECRKRDVNHDTLEVVISTGLTREQLKNVTF